LYSLPFIGTVKIQSRAQAGLGEGGLQAVDFFRLAQIQCSTRNCCIK